MPDKAIIAIFAQNGAQSAYLAEIVRFSGHEARVTNKIEPDAVIVLASGDGKIPIAPNQSVWRVGGAAEEGVRVFKAPLKSAQLIEALRRDVSAKGAVPAKISIGNAELDTRENLWTVRGESPLRLTEKETAILLCLKESEGERVSRQKLLEDVWAYAEGVETHTLETHIYRLRQKIERDPSAPEILLTAEDGYRLGDQ